MDQAIKLQRFLAYQTARSRDTSNTDNSLSPTASPLRASVADSPDANHATIQEEPVRTNRKINGSGGVKSLKERMTPEQLQARAAKTQVRQHIAREHAITRGIAMGALNNTAFLRKRLRLVLVVLVLEALGLAANSPYFPVVVEWVRRHV